MGYIISYLTRAKGAQVDSQGNIELEIGWMSMVVSGGTGNRTGPGSYGVEGWRIWLGGGQGRGEV